MRLKTFLFAATGLLGVVLIWSLSNFRNSTDTSLHDASDTTERSASNSAESGAEQATDAAQLASAPFPSPGSDDSDPPSQGSDRNRSHQEQSALERLRQKGISWPVRPKKPAELSAPSESKEAPEVAAKLAYRALWYLGIDPEAERTWLRAINDVRHDPEFRSDLIADMVDEGYTDNNRPTAADLPLILARLEIIERYAPYAMDEVNARAFERTYEYLLELYLRLGGRSRG